MQHRLTPLRLAAALVLAAGAASALVATAASGASRPSSTPAACVAGQLVNWLNTSGDGYAGGIDYQLEFTNVSTHACSLFGFPGVSAVNLAGHQIGSPATRNGTATRTVTIQPGHAALASLQVVDTGNFPPSACKAVTADGLRVYAPGFRASDVIPFPFSVCSRAHPISISVAAVR